MWSSVNAVYVLAGFIGVLCAEKIATKYGRLVIWKKKCLILLTLHLTDKSIVTQLKKKKKSSLKPIYILEPNK